MIQRGRARTKTAPRSSQEPPCLNKRMRKRRTRPTQHTAPDLFVESLLRFVHENDTNAFLRQPKLWRLSDFLSKRATQSSTPRHTTRPHLVELWAASAAHHLQHVRNGKVHVPAQCKAIKSGALEQRTLGGMLRASTAPASLAIVELRSFDDHQMCREVHSPRQR